MSSGGCKCDVRPAGRFESWDDYDQFFRWLANSDAFVQVPVLNPHSNVGLTETWYRCKTCGSSWRLVEPDPPFAGLWESIKSSG